MKVKGPGIRLEKKIARNTFPAVGEASMAIL